MPYFGIKYVKIPFISTVIYTLDNVLLVFLSCLEMLLCIPLFTTPKTLDRPQVPYLPSSPLATNDSYKYCSKSFSETFFTFALRQICQLFRRMYIVDTITYYVSYYYHYKPLV